MVPLGFEQPRGHREPIGQARETIAYEAPTRQAPVAASVMYAPVITLMKKGSWIA
jgi:hypothetical protein